MGRISDQTKERIRERIDMVALVSEYVTLKPRGSNDHWGRCPFHEEKSASFHVRPDRGLFKCFGCGKGGDVFRFVEEIEGIAFPDALRRLAGQAGVELEPASPQERAREARRAGLLRASALAAELYQEVLWSPTPAGERARAYLAGRGLSEETARAFGLGVAPPAWDTLSVLVERRGVELEQLMELGLVRPGDRGPYDFFRDRLMFPIRDELGKVVAFGGRTLGDDSRKYMNSPEIPGLYEKRKLLYGLDMARKSRPERLVVVEGYMDVVGPHQAGRSEFVAALGTAFTQEQARLAHRYVKEVVLLFDADAAGSNATQRSLAELVGVEGLTVRVVRLPEGKDPDEVVRHDPELLERALSEADDVIAFLVDNALRGYERGSQAAEERAIQAALRLLPRIADGLLLFRKLKLVASRFHIPERVLRERLSQAQVSERRREARKRAPAPPPPAAAAGALGFELHLLEALLALPEAASEAAQRGARPDLFSPGPAREVAGALFAAAEEGPVEAAQVMARVEEPAARALCGRLLGRLSPDKDYARELEGLDALFRRAPERRREELMRRMRDAPDKDTRDRLLAEYAQLRTQFQAEPPVARAP